MRPYLDKSAPEVWKAAGDYSRAVAGEAERRGLTLQESEFIKIRTSQLNACAFCLDLHTREARSAGIPQQKIDLLPAWRDTSLFSERENAVLAIAEAATRLPLTEESKADLSGAHAVLGDEAFAAAEWVALTINMFNRISILSEHPVRPRNDNGKVLS
ncbi:MULTISPECIES: carboxymuconolactone decarboxylase family protein [unclassified Microbacterium]|uniref:carboxymuconolactone decarboxylase family protein n=1 Tax=unclassified Microbacterium TaxID=2609290 RepID=UPI0023053F3D|nr:carboxymuconolactone decarboxylase family protein [Microbacterium sp. nov. GSS16]WCD92306.1 carboxymuconolactone decarboxylase family protein [Microbacterium sp. nov. GSS16]